MVIESSRAATRRFVTVILPWLVGAAALLSYLATFNHWVSLADIGTIAWISGWLCQPELSHPLTCAILFPFRFLPQAWIPPALNIFTVGCAAAVLVLLARSVALLPHTLRRQDHLHPGQPADLLCTPTAWVPPVLAVIVCGFQLSFWEQATSATGEMIDLLLFACVIRCLLEFRISEDQSWLSGCAFVYGAGMANNWAMVGFFPIFFAALVRTKGILGFLNLQFLRRMALWGAAGLCLYLLLPAAQLFSSHGGPGFWAALKTNVESQRLHLQILRLPAFKVLAAISLLPLLILSIRWKPHRRHTGDDNWLAGFLTKMLVHLVHLVFLCTSLWIALDPTFSPRHLALGAPMLTYYYLSAMVAGYCAGYFLALGGESFPSSLGSGHRAHPRPEDPAALSAVSSGRSPLRHTHRHHTPSGGSSSGRWHPATLSVVALLIVLFALALTLVCRNLGQIRITNGPAIREFTRQLYADVPAGKSVVLSDDPFQLLLFQAELGAHRRDKEALPLDSRSLASAQYQAFMADRFKPLWPVAQPTNFSEQLSLEKRLDLLSDLAVWERIVYLHPNAGPFLEEFTERPNGLLHYLTARPTKNSQRPPLSEPLVATNEQLWQQRWQDNLQALSQQVKQESSPAVRRSRSLPKLLRLAAEHNFTLAVLGAAYSRSLDEWGVELQRLGRWREANVWFARALALNPGNLAARINLDYNGRRQQGDDKRLDEASLQRQFGDRFGRYRNWGEISDNDGPFDEPTVLFRVGRNLLDNRNVRQSAREFARCAELAPDWIEPRLWLAASYLSASDFASAFAEAQSIQSSLPPRDGEELSQLLFCRTTALQGLGRAVEADACLAEFLREHRQEDDLLSAAAELYSENERPEEALLLLNSLIQRKPDSPQFLVRKAFAQLQISRCDDAIDSLTAALSFTPPDTRLHRALASVLAGQFQAARSDSQELLRPAGNTRNLWFGLGEIAWSKHDTNATIALYRQCLSSETPGSLQYALVTKRLEQLGAASPAQQQQARGR